VLTGRDSCQLLTGVGIAFGCIGGLILWCGLYVFGELYPIVKR
jgi:hypothetical protein